MVFLVTLLKRLNTFDSKYMTSEIRGKTIGTVKEVWGWERRVNRWNTGVLEAVIVFCMIL